MRKQIDIQKLFSVEKKENSRFSFLSNTIQQFVRTKALQTITGVLLLTSPHVFANDGANISVLDLKSAQETVFRQVFPDVAQVINFVPFSIQSVLNGDLTGREDPRVKEAERRIFSILDAQVKKLQSLFKKNQQLESHLEKAKITLEKFTATLPIHKRESLESLENPKNEKIPPNSSSREEIIITAFQSGNIDTARKILCKQKVYTIATRGYNTEVMCD